MYFKKFQKQSRETHRLFFDGLAFGDNNECADVGLFKKANNKLSLWEDNQYFWDHSLANAFPFYALHMDVLLAFSSVLNGP